jgi:hypothetical protein
MEPYSTGTGIDLKELQNFFIDGLNYKQGDRRLLSRVLASHRGGPGSIPGRDMPVPTPGTSSLGWR